MRMVVQRVSQASVEVEGVVVGSIGSGLLVFVAIARGDRPEDVAAAVDKLAGLRIFPDAEERMNLSLVEVGGEVLVVSQFTLLADLARGRRPSFTAAAAPEIADRLLSEMVAMLRDGGIPTATGVFGARMAVTLVNQGPVTIVVDIREGRVLPAQPSR